MTEVQNFYRNKNIFLTGGTGFLGKVFIEKVLRVTDVAKIFVLIREKKGKTINERIADIFSDPLFDKLNETKPLARQRIVPVCGDCVLPNLGLAPEDVGLLLENAQIVVHSAATVRFNEAMSSAVSINVQATIDLLELARKMKRLEAFVHVSSAFANCLDDHIEERFYTERLNITAKQVCNMAQNLGTDVMDSLSEKLCNKFPNSYCFTKALAEEAVLTSGSDLPICIFRPGIVVPICDEPVAGWIDNLYGPTSILFGAVHGVLRVLYIDIETNCCIVPVDFCANAMLACAWRVAEKKTEDKSAQTPRIYNLVPDVRNIIKWSQYKECIETVGAKIPITRMVWFPFLVTTNNKLAYTILSFIYHTIPGYFFDLFLLLTGRKTRMVKMYRKITMQTLLLEYFVKHNFTFTMENTMGLWSSLCPEDQRLFRFDVLSIDWPKYFNDSLYGMRKFIAKEGPDTIPKGRSLLKRLYILHRGLQCLICGGGLTLLYWTLSKMFI